MSYKVGAIVSVLAVALFSLVSVASAQVQEYVVVPVGLGEMVSEGVIIFMGEGAGTGDCVHDPVSVRCKASVSGAGTGWEAELSRDDFGLGVDAGEILGFVMDVVYQTNVATGTYGLWIGGAGRSVPASLTPASLTYCFYDPSGDVYSGAPAGGVACDYVVAHPGFLSPSYPIRVGVWPGDNKSMNAVFYNFGYIVQAEAGSDGGGGDSPGESVTFAQAVAGYTAGIEAVSAVVLTMFLFAFARVMIGFVRKALRGGR